MPSIAPFTGFTPKAFTFLRGLARRNEKAWFEAHRAQYEGDLRGPMIALVDEMDARFGTLAPEIVGDRRRSVFRIHRDVRFSKDKRPYKTNAAAWFFHRDVTRARQGERAGDTAGGAVHGGAGFYVQLAPGDCFVGGGLWMPPRQSLALIRNALDADPKGLERIVGTATFRKRFGALDQEGMLTRAPRGWPPDHPASPWLRYTSFTAGRKLSDAETLGAGLPALLVKEYTALLPLVRWLNGALGLLPAERR